MFKFNKSSGQVARLLLVLAVVVLVAIVITFLIIKMAEKPAKPVVVETEKVPVAVYEKKLGNIKFTFMSALDLGNTLKASDAVNSNYSSKKDLTTTERFVEVTIGAQNLGTANTDQGAWDTGNVIDSDGRKFIAVDGYIVNQWLPEKNTCGVLLKPAFDPIPCIKIYEVSKLSKGLKIEVMTGQNNNSANDFSGGKRLIETIDLILK